MAREALRYVPVSDEHDLVAKDEDAAGRDAPRGKTFSFGFSSGEPPADLRKDSDASPQIATKRYECKFGGGAERPPEREPATYYKALTGQPNPMRDFFITSRWILSIVTWAFANALPVGALILALATHQSSETVFFIVFAATLVAGMIKATLALVGTEAFRAANRPGLWSPREPCLPILFKFAGIGR